MAEAAGGAPPAAEGGAPAPAAPKESSWQGGTLLFAGGTGKLQNSPCGVGSRIGPDGAVWQRAMTWQPSSGQRRPGLT